MDVSLSVIFHVVVMSVEVTLIVIVVRCFRTDGSGRKNRQFAIEKIESDAAVKSRR